MMHFYAVYDPATGAILRTGFCTQSCDVALQAREAEAVIAADALCPADRYAVDVARTPPVLVTRG
jgi:hypothetical protein